MSAPLTVSVPHRLGKDEAVRRLKGGMSDMASKLGALITIEREVWEGDTLTFQMRGFGQSASGTIAVFEELDPHRRDAAVAAGKARRAAAAGAEKGNDAAAREEALSTRRYAAAPHLIKSLAQ